MCAVGEAQPKAEHSSRDGKGSSNSLARPPSSSSEPLKVTIAAGPQAGKEARVLHVGNEWVKLQLPNGSVVHLRKLRLGRGARASFETFPRQFSAPSNSTPNANGGRF